MTKTTASRKPLGSFSARSKTLAGLALPLSPNTTSSKPVSNYLHSFNFSFVHSFVSSHFSSFLSAVATGSNSKPVSIDVTADHIDLDEEQGTDHSGTNYLLLFVCLIMVYVFFLCFVWIRRNDTVLHGGNCCSTVRGY